MLSMWLVSTLELQVDSFGNIPTGIHGVPFKPWNTVQATPGNEQAGYCQHLNILFPTWHRAYVALFEVSVYSTPSSSYLVIPSYMSALLLLTLFNSKSFVTVRNSLPHYTLGISGAALRPRPPTAEHLTLTGRPFRRLQRIAGFLLALGTTPR